MFPKMESLDIVRDVTVACQCSEEDAIRLLEQCNNNVEQAKIRHTVETTYGVSTSCQATQPPQWPQNYDLDLISYESSDDDLTLVTPSSTEAVVNSPNRSTKRPPPPTKPKKLRMVQVPDDTSDNIEEKQNFPTSTLSVQDSSNIGNDELSTLGTDDPPLSESKSHNRLTMDQKAGGASPPILSTSEEGQIRNSPFRATMPMEPIVEPSEPLEEEPIAEYDIIDNSAQSTLQLEDSLLERAKEPEWDFVLPVVPPPLSLTPGIGKGSCDFSLRDLVGAIQHETPIRSVVEYLAYYDSETVRRNICDTVEGFPSIFFAVGTNNESVLRLWIASGADISAIHEGSKVPLLAFAIMNSENLETDTTMIVSTLLSLGAIPETIPSSIYTPFTQDLPDNGPSEETLKGDMLDETKSWCTSPARSKLARTTNITQRYYLERASKSKKPSKRHKQVAKLRNAEALLGISYFLVGQTMATNRLFQKLLNYMMVPTKRPLVMVFAGPSGHGKTELARKLGHLMSLDLEIVDCTIYNREIELFGPRNPYVGAENGSPLNNFLAKNAGKRCIVFLDEFEKTTTDIHQALLVPFDNGEYQDRRDLKQIDCSKTVWILATNALDSTIQSFCKQHHKQIFQDDDDSEKLKLMKTLSKAIKEDFLSQFGSPVTGRISDFLPFLPFSPGEQAVIVHKFLLELGQKVKGRVNLVPGPNEQLLGNVRLKIRKDASVCRILAEEEYHSDLGARSLIVGARKLEDALVEVYLEVDEEISESEKLMDFVVDVVGSEVTARIVQQKESEEMERS